MTGAYPRPFARCVIKEHCKLKQVIHLASVLTRQFRRTTEIWSKSKPSNGLKRWMPEQLTVGLLHGGAKWPWCQCGSIMFNPKWKRENIKTNCACQPAKPVWCPVWMCAMILYLDSMRQNPMVRSWRWIKSTRLGVSDWVSWIEFPRCMAGCMSSGSALQMVPCQFGWVGILFAWPH